MQDMHSELPAETRTSAEKKASVPRYITVLLVIALFMGAANLVSMIHLSNRLPEKRQLTDFMKAPARDTTWKIVPILGPQRTEKAKESDVRMYLGAFFTAYYNQVSDTMLYEAFHDPSDYMDYGLQDFLNKLSIYRSIVPEIEQVKFISSHYDVAPDFLATSWQYRYTAKSSTGEDITVTIFMSNRNTDHPRTVGFALGPATSGT